MQTLLQSAPERAASTMSVQSLGLRQALQRAEVRPTCTKISLLEAAAISYSH